ncbi:MAG: iron-sulfur cluster assembly scaffold protein [Verrucomicrobia bacterium]|nr:iron-sulfur cluster assembly scaffold protein [Verrucomicrobiota bacterium]
MNSQKLLAPFPWSCYSKKLAQKIENPRHCGQIAADAAKERGMRLVKGLEGQCSDGNAVCLYLLVDESDGVIADAKFQAFGQSALIGAAEAACELLIRKNYDQARRLTAELLDRQVRDKEGINAFPPETFPHVNLVIGAIENATEQCFDIPFAEAYVPTPLDIDSQISDGPYPGWSDLSTGQKIAVIENVIDKDIRPYIELDAGGIEIVNLVNDRELVIAYQGACTTCYSATGSTLDAIQQILKAKVDPALVVIPDASFLQGAQSAHPGAEHV